MELATRNSGLGEAFTKEGLRRTSPQDGHLERSKLIRRWSQAKRHGINCVEARLSKVWS